MINHMVLNFRCAGVEIDDISFVDQLPDFTESNVIKDKRFFPYFTTEKVDVSFVTLFVYWEEEIDF